MAQTLKNIFILGMIAFVFLMALTIPMMLSGAYTGLSFISAESGRHADAVHGVDAAQGRNCFNHHGYFESWQERTTGAFHFLCRYPGESKIYDIIATRDKNGWHEKTVFSPADGTYQWIKKWLHSTAKKAVQVRVDDPPTGFPQP